MFVTNLKAKRSSHSSKSKSFMVKSSRNNGGKGPNACLYSRDGREQEGADGCNFLCYRLITVGFWLEPTVVELNHCRFVA